MDRKDSSTGRELAQFIREINRMIQKRLRTTFQESGLTPPQLMILHYLFRHDSCRVNDISDHLRLAASTVSSILDRLERNGFVFRERNKTDKRMVDITLTPKANNIKTTLKTDLTNSMNEMTNEATADEVSRIHDGLKLMKDVLERKGGGTG